MSGGNGRSGFDRANVKGWVAKRVDMCVLTVKKERFDCFNRSIFCVSFLEVFFVNLFLCFFGLMDASGSYLKKGGSLVFVCQVDGVPESSESHQPFQAPIAKSEKKIREEKRELLGFCRNEAENLLDLFFWPFFLGPLKTKTLFTTSFFWQNLGDKVFFAGFLESSLLVELRLFSTLRKGILARDLAGALKVSDEEMGDGYPSRFCLFAEIEASKT